MWFKGIINFGKKVRVRAAPSPTGSPHIGNIRTVLFNYLFACSRGGNFIVRIEDTDQKRSVPKAEEEFLEALHWLGITWHEGPFRQSERLSLYQQYAERLVKEKKAYYCFCSKERLLKIKKQQEKEHQSPKYDQHCRKLTDTAVREKLSLHTTKVIRLAVPHNETVTFSDILRGTISVSSSELEDSILLKSDGFPTYHLANVVDDHLMRITHVIRAEEWLPSTSKHVLLYRFFKWNPPIFAHVPLVLNEQHQKLSKRDGIFSVMELKKEGYLPEAILNYVALLGWRPKNKSNQEIFSLQELKHYFRLEDVHASPAVFDRDKLDWTNAQHIKRLSPEEFLRQIERYITDTSIEKNFLKRFVEIEQVRFVKLSDVTALIRPFCGDVPQYNPQLLIWKKMSMDTVKRNLAIIRDILQSIPESAWTVATLEKSIQLTITEKKFVVGEVLWPLRVALTGEKKSPGPFECAYILGKERTLARINAAL